ncbi:phosphate ABC transporter permease subunit PstC [Nakamurella lactea]|uniref:phosphate ABC transporter permease subunit PstC n=1 Tax=Nakamurella lactea TaxID=459515 RepID=UPI000422BBC4|nr:phosphate ABC transporter permease subunit PstC [Nakamurella lactea]
MSSTAGSGSMTEPDPLEEELRSAGAVADEQRRAAPAPTRGPADPPSSAAGGSGTVRSSISGQSVRRGDRVFKGLAAGSGAVLLVVMAAIAAFLVWKAWPALFAGDANKGNLFTTQKWSFSSEGPSNFGVAALAFGTIVSATIAMAIGVPVAIGIALYISHYAPRRLATVLGGLVDLLAAVPSLVFGMWGLYLLVPKTQGFQSWLNEYFSWTYIFDNTRFTNPNQYGQSLLMAGIVLAIMILPVVSAVCREVFLQTPRETVDAAWALGATKWETIRTAVLPFGRAGMISAAMLGLGRALGETIAVALLLSSAFKINGHLTEKAGDTFASTIALKFGEASGTPLGIPALITAGLFLFVITLIVNSIARAIIARKKDFTA